jgi:hypothetical protein
MYSQQQRKKYRGARPPAQPAAVARRQPLQRAAAIVFATKYRSEYIRSQERTQAACGPPKRTAQAPAARMRNGTRPGAYAADTARCTSHSSAMTSTGGGCGARNSDIGATQRQHGRQVAAAAPCCRCTRRRLVQPSQPQGPAGQRRSTSAPA